MKQISLLFLKLFNTLRFRGYNFIVPNLIRLWSKKLKINGIPICQQKTIITGSGNVIIGYKAKFGYKRGGFHRGGCIEVQARYKDSKVIIGDHIATNNNIFICSAGYIEIGDKVLIGQNVTIMDFEAHGVEIVKRNQVGSIGKILISNNVWIGNNVTILKNTEIGENTIVAVGAVVSGKFPSNVIIGGVPAKIIKNI